MSDGGSQDGDQTHPKREEYRPQVESFLHFGILAIVNKLRTFSVHL